MAERQNGRWLFTSKKKRLRIGLPTATIINRSSRPLGGRYMHIEYIKHTDDVNTPKRKENDITLKSFSKKDGKWDSYKKHNISFQTIFSNSKSITNHKWADRMEECANTLSFNYVVNEETGELQIKLQSANFCHVRHCPVCDWRRSLRAQAMFKNALPKIIENNPQSRWIFLTLTVPNCPIEELRETITTMNKAWVKMLKRKGLSFVKGWSKKVEVTQEENRRNYAHPHFHCILQVNESYFKHKQYLKKMDWVQYWSDAMKSDILLNVDVRALRKKFDVNDQAITELLKTFNYSVKADSIENDAYTQEWFLEYVEQVRSLKFLTSGGTLKNIFKDQREGEESNEDLIHVDDKGDPIMDENTNPQLLFFYKQSRKQYVKKKD